MRRRGFLIKEIILAHTEERIIEKNGMRIKHDVLIGTNEDIYLNGDKQPINVEQSEPEKPDPSKPIIIAGSKFSGPNDAFANNNYDETKPVPIPRNRQEIFLGIREIQTQKNGVWETFEGDIADLYLEIASLQKRNVELKKQNAVLNKKLEMRNLSSNSDEGENN